MIDNTLRFIGTVRSNFATQGRPKNEARARPGEHRHRTGLLEGLDGLKIGQEIIV
jgi:hypothetical protein